MYIDFAGSESEEWSSGPTYVTVIVAVASLLSSVVLLILCASCCRRRQRFDTSRPVVFEKHFVVFLFLNCLTFYIIIIIIRSSLLGQWHATRTCPSLVSSTPL